MKLLIKQFPPICYYFIPLSSKYSPRTHSAHFPPQMSETKFHTHKQTTSKLTYFNLSIFEFLDSRREEEERIWTEQ
jgi:hypothetical protein